MTDLSQSPAPALRLWRRTDKVAVAFIAILAILAATDPSALPAIVGEMLASFAGTLPFILLAVAAIASMRAAGAERLLDGAFVGHEVRMIAIGALAGGLSPFCSCQVIPFIAALLAAGAPLSAVMAFWLASPLMDPAMFTITAGTLGLDFAIGKTVAAVGLGLFGGLAVMAFARTPVFADPLREQPARRGCCGAKKATTRWRFWQEAERRQVFAREAGSNLLFLGKWLLFAYLLQALLIRYVPADLIATVIGGDGPGPVILAALVGAPAYLNGYAAVPLIEGLLAQGMSQGAAMAFMIAGGVSCIPAAVAVWALVKPRVFAAYLGFAVVGAMLAGFAWGALT
ncbi:permease [Rhodobacterales bacterium HKCCE3408]|nr:permease [Rhodobacterales bacterium HKCCE3408]